MGRRFRNKRFALIICAIAPCLVPEGESTVRITVEGRGFANSRDARKRRRRNRDVSPMEVVLAVPWKDATNRQGLRSFAQSTEAGFDAMNRIVTTWPWRLEAWENAFLMAVATVASTKGVNVRCLGIPSFANRTEEVSAVLWKDATNL